MKSTLLLISILFYTGLPAQQKTKPSFRVVPLGIKGGIDESNLSAYLVAPWGTNEYVCLDGGTIHAGIVKAISTGAFKANASEVLKRYIRGYFISHAHLDHVAGMIIGSPEDSSKTVYALPACMKMMEDYYFNGDAWANFGDAGKSYQIKKYHFQTLVAGETSPVRNTSMQVTAFPLSHVNPFESTAFLLRNNNSYFLYLGDTGPDSIEHSNKLQVLWQTVAPLIKTNQLKGIFIEVSFPNDQPDNKLFGHLTPKWLMQEMSVLGKLTGTADLKKVKIIITHVKPPASRIRQLTAELKKANTMGLQLIFPRQGKAFSL